MATRAEDRGRSWRTVGLAVGLGCAAAVAIVALAAAYLIFERQVSSAWLVDVPLYSVVLVPCVGLIGVSFWALDHGAGSSGVWKVLQIAVPVYVLCAPVLLLWWFFTIECGLPFRNGYC